MSRSMNAAPVTLNSTPIRDLGLRIEGTRLEGIIRGFLDELRAADITQVQPHFYLSTEWGVPFNTISIAIPFYLATKELSDVHFERHGHVEGETPRDVLRYLRHEMGHVLNYAYLLYEEKAWVEAFGSMTQPYEEEFKAEPFSQRYVEHLPGWYAQKHPDEDWSETFAVWLTPPKGAWRDEYRNRPVALRKLEYCDNVIAELSSRKPVVLTTELDEDVGTLTCSIDEFYQHSAAQAALPPGIDGSLRAIFESDQPADAERMADHRPAADLIRIREADLMANIYRWTGHFPERTRYLARNLAHRAEELQLSYPPQRELAAIIGVTALISALAMNEMIKGTYSPAAR